MAWGITQAGSLQPSNFVHIVWQRNTMMVCVKRSSIVFLSNFMAFNNPTDSLVLNDIVRNLA